MFSLEILMHLGMIDAIPRFLLTKWKSAVRGGEISDRADRKREGRGKMVWKIFDSWRIALLRFDSLFSLSLSMPFVPASSATVRLTKAFSCSRLDLLVF